MTWVKLKLLYKRFLSRRLGDRDFLDKAARKARIEAVEVLGKRMDTYMDTTGRKRKEEKIDIPKLLPAQ